MRGAVLAALAVVEVIAVFIGATLAVRGLKDVQAISELRHGLPDPVVDLAFRWAPLILVALIVDFALRRRGLGAWGLVKETPFDPLAAARLLVIGGAIPLVLTCFDSPATQSILIANAGDFAAIAAAFAIPLVGQELFVVGYARRRFVDHSPAWLVLVLVMGFFVLAHAEHAARGAPGVAFLAAMAWQGLWWALARRAGVSLLTLMAAHLALLLAYEQPLWGVAAVGALAVFTAFGASRWIESLWTSRET